MAAAEILLVETDGPSAALIGAALTVQGHEVRAVGSLADAVAAAPEADLVLIDVLPGANASIEVCRALRAAEGAAGVERPRPILAIAGADDVDERIALLEAGADDVMTRPFDPSELEARVAGLLLRVQRTGETGAAPVRGLVGDGMAAPGSVRLVTVFSPKGGAGATTVAVNLAVAAATASGSDRILLIDLDVRWGQAATFLNLVVPHTLADLMHDAPARRDPALFRSYAIRHASGVHLLAAPTSVGGTDSVAPALVAEAISTALTEFDLVIVDAGSVLDDLSLMALDSADAVVVPVVPDVPALKPVVQLFEYLNETGQVADKVTLVLNQIHSRRLISDEQIEGLLGVRLAARLPYDEANHLRATNEGAPVVALAPRAPVAAAYAKLLAAATGLAGGGAATEGEKRRSFRLR